MGEKGYSQQLIAHVMNVEIYTLTSVSISWVTSVSISWVISVSISGVSDLNQEPMETHINNDLCCYEDNPRPLALLPSFFFYV